MIKALRVWLIRLALAGVAVMSARMSILQIDTVHRSTAAELELTNLPLERVEVSDGPSQFEFQKETSQTPFRREGLRGSSSLSHDIRKEFSRNELKDSFAETREGLRTRRRERKKRIQYQQKRKKEKLRRRRVDLKVPYPIFIPSLPKSGTTTTHRYFECGGQKSAHLAGRNETNDSIFRIGRCAQKNVEAGKPPFEGCGDYDVWSDTGEIKS